MPQILRSRNFAQLSSQQLTHPFPRLQKQIFGTKAKIPKLKSVNILAILANFKDFSRSIQCNPVIFPGPVPISGILAQDHFVPVADSPCRWYSGPVLLLKIFSVEVPIPVPKNNEENSGHFRLKVQVHF